MEGTIKVTSRAYDSALEPNSCIQQWLSISQQVQSRTAYRSDPSRSRLLDSNDALGTQDSRLRINASVDCVYADDVLRVVIGVLAEDDRRKLMEVVRDADGIPSARIVLTSMVKERGQLAEAP